MTATPATQDPRLNAVEHRVVETGPVGSLDEAARLRGVTRSQVIKTMVVRRNANDYVFVLVPGDRVIDWPKLRNVLGERRLSMADADEALAVTGYERGTITPLGASTMWPVFADQRLQGGMVSVGGGAHGVSITISGGDLVLITSA
ncbi:MAG: YbaK/EbsC family protein, partial [Acidimicrobiia bacterium]